MRTKIHADLKVQHPRCKSLGNVRKTGQATQQVNFDEYFAARHKIFVTFGFWRHAPDAGDNG